MPKYLCGLGHFFGGLKSKKKKREKGTPSVLGYNRRTSDASNEADQDVLLASRPNQSLQQQIAPASVEHQQLVQVVEGTTGHEVEAMMSRERSTIVPAGSQRGTSPVRVGRASFQQMTSGSFTTSSAASDNKPVYDPSKIFIETKGADYFPVNIHKSAFQNSIKDNTLLFNQHDSKTLNDTLKKSRLLYIIAYDGHSRVIYGVAQMTALINLNDLECRVRWILLQNVSFAKDIEYLTGSAGFHDKVVMARVVGFEVFKWYQRKCREGSQRSSTRNSARSRMKTEERTKSESVNNSMMQVTAPNKGYSFPSVATSQYQSEEIMEQHWDRNVLPQHLKSYQPVSNKGETKHYLVCICSLADDRIAKMEQFATFSFYPCHGADISILSLDSRIVYLCFENSSQTVLCGMAMVSSVLVDKYSPNTPVQLHYEQCSWMTIPSIPTIVTLQLGYNLRMVQFETDAKALLQAFSYRYEEDERMHRIECVTNVLDPKHICYDVDGHHAPPREASGQRYDSQSTDAYTDRCVQPKITGNEMRNNAENDRNEVLGRAHEEAEERRERQRASRHASNASGMSERQRENSTSRGQREKLGRERDGRELERKPDATAWENQRRVEAEQRRVEAENQRRVEAEQRRVEAENQRRVETKQLRVEAENRLKVEAEQRRVEAENRLKVEAEQRRVEAENRRRAEAEQSRVEAENQRKVEAENRRRAEAQQGRVEAENQRKVEAENRSRAEAEQLRVEAENRRKVEAKQRRVEAEQRSVEAENRRRAEADQSRAEAENRRRVEAENKRRVEAENQRKVEEEQRRVEAENQRRAEAEQRRVEVEQLRVEAENQRKVEAEQLRVETENRRRAEAEQRRVEAENRRIVEALFQNKRKTEALETQRRAEKKSESYNGRGNENNKGEEGMLPLDSNPGEEKRKIRTETEQRFQTDVNIGDEQPVEKKNSALVESDKKSTLCAKNPEKPGSTGKLKKTTNAYDVEGGTPAKRIRNSVTRNEKNRGLMNLGNTCYMNSVLQCVAMANWGEDLYTDHVDLLLKEFFALMRDMVTGDGKYTLTPDRLKGELSQLSTRFASYHQQDAHEFLTFLLDSVDQRIRSMEETGFATNNSIHDNFIGVLESTTSMRCKHVDRIDQKIFSVSVPVDLKAPILLKDCIERFTREEELDEEDKARCQRCKKFVCCSVKLSFKKLPKILVIHLKKFDFMAHCKLDIDVKFPIREYLHVHALDNTEDSTSSQPGTIYGYKLYGICNHSGSLAGGHYTAIARAPQSKQWYKYDDSYVTKSSEDSIERNSKAAYLLFYQLEKSYSEGTAL